jgi:hypothetical protein
MDGAAHGEQPHDIASLERRGELLGLEAVEARGE